MVHINTQDQMKMKDYLILYWFSFPFMTPNVEREGPFSREWSRGPDWNVKWRVAGLAGR